MKKRLNNWKRIISGSLRHKGSCDFVIIALTTILVIFGIAMVFSASYYFSLYNSGSPYQYLKKQTLFAIPGFGLLYLFSKLDYHFLQRCSHLLWIIGVFLLVAVLLVGTNVNGATRWIYIGPLSLMPGELIKLPVIFLISAFYSKNDGRIESFVHGILPAAFVVAVTCGLIWKQPNLSTAMTIAGIVFGIMVVAGIRQIWLKLAGGAIIGGIGLILFADEFLGDSNAYWAKRITSFLNPFADPKGDGYQVVQSLLAMGTGGFKGLGLGQSIQKNLYLPEPQNDFILSIIGEELGFAGIFVLLVIFLLLIWRCMKVALNAPDRYGLLVASGVAIMIGIQVIFNVAVVTSSMPPTGVALPFISYGGNTLWVCMTGIGVVLNVSRYQEYSPEDAHEMKHRRRHRSKSYRPAEEYSSPADRRRRMAHSNRTTYRTN